MKILITGGAGFVGSHIVDELIKLKHNVRIFDNLDPQVHSNIPKYINSNAEFLKGDLRNINDLKEALKDVEIIFHEASAVGVGQSMYKINHYVDSNTLGTANLLHLLVNSEHNVKKLIVASSMSIYGEGAYECEKCGIVYPKDRKESQLKEKDWEMRCPKCNTHVKPIPTNESKPLNPTSIYAMTKRHQEEMSLLIGKTYGIPTVALRYFNIYGPRQSLNNPYTGVAAIFLSRIKNNNPPLIFEDGLQSRDFIHVSDIVNANILAMKNSNMNYKVFNVGTGKQTTILDIAKILIESLGSNVKPEIINKYRKGDIRHCYADISKIKSYGFEPKIHLEEGMKNLIELSKGVEAKDNVENAKRELQEKGLIE